MDLNKLFQIQAELDNRIVEEHNLQGVDLLDKKILALQVELAECAQESRCFKFWSKDQKPRVEEWIKCEQCDGTVRSDLGTHCHNCETGYVGVSNPLLEEYVDCLHFILSIGLELGYTFNKIAKQKSRTVTLQFIDSFHATAILFESIESDWDEDEKQENFENVVAGFLGLGEMLGFTWEQVEQSYLEKNRINHERQNNGY